MRSPIVQRKHALRHRMIRALRQLSTAERRREVADLSQHLSRLLSTMPVGGLAAFWPLPGEVDLRPLLRDLKRRGWVIGLPRLCGSGLEVRRVRDFRTLHRGLYGTREPSLKCPVLRTLDVILVPGVAFDATGARLGRGGGYYDRFLFQHHGVLTVGVGFSCQLISRVPRQVHDARVSIVVTPHLLIGRGKKICV